MNEFANEILSSINPQEKFQSYISKSPEAQNAFGIVQKYGNGDPKLAFQKYMIEQGKEELGKMIMSRLGLN